MLAVIGGTGFNKILESAEIEHIKSYECDTPYGSPSSPIKQCLWHGKSVFLLNRHGDQHQQAPHKINYRANIYALHKLGVKTIISINAVGSMVPLPHPGCLVMPHQLIDYTWGRESTFFQDNKGVHHVEFSEPFDNELRIQLATAGKCLDQGLIDFGIYGCTQGPRLETVAEIDRLERDGCDLVGMTLMPEAALAREKAMAFAVICMVVNPAAGRGDGPISMPQIEAAIKQASASATQLLNEFVISA